jgi:2-dehydropantoate 2-reductase
MRFAIFGVGAIGGYFGGRLAQIGEDVVFIARGDTLRALRSTGLRLTSISGNFLLSPVNAVENPAQIGPVDVVLLGVKTWQVPEAADALRPLVGPNTMVLPLQNGVEAAAQLAEVLGGKHVCCGLAKIFCYLAEPGHVRHSGIDPYIALGGCDNRPTERIRELRGILQQAGIRAEIPSDIAAALWEKFLFVASWGGIGAVSRAPIGVLRAMPGTRRMLEQAMREILNVARARNIDLQEDIVASSMGFIDSLPPAGTTSMQRDIAEGRPSEIDAWNGAAVRFGDEAGVDVTLNKFIYDSLRPLELKARGEVSFV